MPFELVDGERRVHILEDEVASSPLSRLAPAAASPSTSSTCRLALALAPRPAAEEPSLASSTREPSSRVLARFPSP